MSPLSTAATIGSGVMGVVQKAPSIIESLCKGITAIKNFGKPPTGAQSLGTAGILGQKKKASGGLITSQNYNNANGCASLRDLGALPCRR
jgi:hypothetical protein